MLNDKKIYIENKKVVLQNGNQEYLYKFKIDDIERQKINFYKILLIFHLIL